MRCIIDTDMGVDDAQAVMLALNHSDTTVEAITTVSGNVPVDKVNRNVLTLLAVMEQDVLVYSGATLPLVAHYEPEAPEVHGTDGMGDWRERPDGRGTVEAEHAALALIRMANAAPGALTLVTLGPLTNIALAVRLDPTFASKIAALVMMGGTIAAVGNTDSLTAEWNIFVDPEAAYVTFGAFNTITLVSWETTLTHPIPWERYERLSSGTAARARFFKGITESSIEWNRSNPRFGGFLIPDPLAMAVALNPELVNASERQYVTVELTGTHTRGQTVIDYADRLQREPNTTLVTAIDMDGVLDLYERLLS